MKRSTERSPDLYVLAFVSILALAAFLRFYCLTCSSLWHDEGNSWALAQRSFVQIATDAAADIHPPGYYWLLKLWAGVFGYSGWGIRSLSALAGLLTVAVVYRIGMEIEGEAKQKRSELALLGAFIAAHNPFQVYYSQEARMYALLMLESAALVWALLAMRRRWTVHGAARTVGPYAVLYLVAAASGLWTHYTFAAVLAATAGAAVWWWWPRWSETRRQWQGDARRPVSQSDALPAKAHPHRVDPWLPLLSLLLLNGLALLFILPWLPTTIERLLSWPSQNGYVGPLEGLGLTLQTLATGSIRSGPELAWGWLLLVGLLPLGGLWQLRRSGAGAALLLWTLLPIGVMFGFGLFNPSFLKFLLVISPAWCLLAAAAAQPFTSQKFFNLFLSLLGRKIAGECARTSTLLRPVALGTVATLAAMLTLATLPGYYADPVARDNYAGIARTIAALGDPTQDLVVLNAPGQADVWRFYDIGLDVLPLPAERPPDRTKTEETLARETASRQRVFAILWATEQSDWDGIVEGWLSRNAFKGLESWQGNVRFATYTLAHGLTCTALDQPPRFGDVTDLTEICLGEEPLAAGDTLLVGLRWLPLTAPERRYIVTVQLLDLRNQVVVQLDGEPGGGAVSTRDWKPGELVHDNHGLPLPPGAPPGDYQLIVALYDAETGARLSTPTGDAVQIARPTLERPARPLPVSLIPGQSQAKRELGPLTVVGYDFHRKTFAHAPDTALAPGDIVQVTLYWQAPTPLPENWPVDLALKLGLGDQVIEAPLAGGGYPTGHWQAGELVRSSFDIPYDGSDSTLWLEVGDSRLRLGEIPHGK